MDKPTKRGGVWSFIGLSTLFSIPSFIITMIIDKNFIIPFTGEISFARNNIIQIIMFFGALGTIFLTVHVYTKTRIISQRFAKRVCLINLIISGFLALPSIMAMFIWPELRDTSYYGGPIATIINVIANLLLFYIARKLLLHKAEQQSASQHIDALIVQYKINVDGKDIQTEELVVNIDDRTYLPIRKVSELLGMEVVWDGGNQTVFINTNKEENSNPLNEIDV